MAGKVLVSGSSGLIGRAVVSSLQASGQQVTRLVRGSATKPEEISWDPARPVVPETVSGFDAVIHLAGETIMGRWTESKKSRIRESRVLGTRNLAEALAKAQQPPRIIISGSAIGYYGDRGEEVLRENSAPGKGFLPDVCQEWEAATEPATKAGIRTVQLRTGVVLSKDGGALRKMLPAFRMGVGGRIGSGRQWMSWIGVRDIAGAILHILASEDLQGPVNAVSPMAVTNLEFTKTLAAMLFRPAIFPVPALAARLAFGQMADELLLASQRVEPAKLSAQGYTFQLPHLSQALAAVLK